MSTSARRGDPAGPRHRVVEAVADGARVPDEALGGESAGESERGVLRALVVAIGRVDAEVAADQVGGEPMLLSSGRRALRFLAWIETSPACRISRATRFSPIAMPRPSLSSLKIRGEP